MGVPVRILDTLLLEAPDCVESSRRERGSVVEKNLQRQLFSVQDAAEFLGVSDSTIRRYISDGRLSAYRLGDERLIRIQRQDLESLLSPIEPNKPLEGVDAEV